MACLLYFMRGFFHSPDIISYQQQILFLFKTNNKNHDGVYITLTERIVHNLDDVPPGLSLGDSELPHGDPVPHLLLDVQLRRELRHPPAQILNVLGLHLQSIV